MTTIRERGSALDGRAFARARTPLAQHRRIGIMLVVVAGVFWSLQGPTVRMTEVVLAPIWVWAAFDEVPSAYTLAGGAIVLGAICIEAMLRVRHVERP